MPHPLVAHQCRSTHCVVIIGADMTRSPLTRLLEEFRRAIRITERAGATLFISLVVYCGLVDAFALSASVATQLLRLAKVRTHHALTAVVELANELQRWP